MPLPSCSDTTGSNDNTEKYASFKGRSPKNPTCRRRAVVTTAAPLNQGDYSQARNDACGGGPYPHCSIPHKHIRPPKTNPAAEFRCRVSALLWNYFIGSGSWRQVMRQAFLPFQFISAASVLTEKPSLRLSMITGSLFPPLIRSAGQLGHWLSRDMKA